jgi:N-alpha-acetyltransferase 10/11
VAFVILVYFILNTHHRFSEFDYLRVMSVVLDSLHLPEDSGEKRNQTSIPFESSSWYSDENGIIRHRSTSVHTLPPTCTIDVIQFCIQSESINAHLALTNTNILYKKYGYLFQFEGYNHMSDKDALKSAIFLSASKSNVNLKELKIGKNLNTIRFICSIFQAKDVSETENSIAQQSLIQETSCNLCLKLKYDNELGGWFLMPYRLVWTAEDQSGMVVGYLFAKLEHDRNENSILNAHITSVSVLKSHRKRGIATRLMQKSHAELDHLFGPQYISLHVRKNNEGAFHLYHEILKYGIYSIKKGYYADGEDAYCMRYLFE